MAPGGGSAGGRPRELALDAQWDACLDLTLRRGVYASLAGLAAGLLLFRAPASRWACLTFGAGAGLGSAYTDCSHIFDGSSSKWLSTAPAAAAPSSEPGPIATSKDPPPPPPPALHYLTAPAEEGAADEKPSLQLHCDRTEGEAAMPADFAVLLPSAGSCY
eukprot:SM000189S04116  [mRNA]  locus=s189:255140:256068:- [translate_table: standard]